MPQFKTLQFPNTAGGQADKIRALERETARGWRVVSETIVPGKFRGAQACCLFLIFAPCAFLAGHDADTITVTLERDDGYPDVAPSGSAIPVARFDRQKWNALLMYDKEIASAAEIVRPFGSKWMDELAAGYMTLADNKYLQGIVDNIVQRATQEKLEREAELARQTELREAETRERERVLAEQKERYRRWYNILWGTNQRRALTAVCSVAIVIILVVMIWHLYVQSGWSASGGAEMGSSNVGTSEPPQPSAATSQSPSGDIAATEGPSFNCTRVRSQVLKLVCATPSLAVLDRRLAATYSAAALATSSPTQLKSDERRWIQQRNNSEADTELLEQMYQDRISYLNGIASQKSSPNDQSTNDASLTPGVSSDASQVPPGAPPPAVPAVPSADDIMGSRFGNTIIARGADAEWHLYFQAGGIFSGREIRSGYRVTGTWELNQGNLCLTFQQSFAGAPNPDCQPASTHSVGETWTKG